MQLLLDILIGGEHVINFSMISSWGTLGDLVRHKAGTFLRSGRMEVTQAAARARSELEKHFVRYSSNEGGKRRKAS
jgi:hypothetical protein